MYADSFDPKYLTEVQHHAIQRITDLEYALGLKAATGETFEIERLELPSREWAVRLVHRNPFGHTIAYDGAVLIQQFQAGLHDVTIDFKDAGFKVGVASRGEAYHGPEKTRAALAHQYGATFVELRERMPLKPFHIELKATPVETVDPQPVDHLDLSHMFKKCGKPGQQAGQPKRRSMWDVMTAGLKTGRRAPSRDARFA